ncbi:MAG: hypothetical protein ACQES1_06645 [Bacteroidota bacterium]
MEKPVITYWVDLFNRVKDVTEVTNGFAITEMPPPFSHPDWKGKNLMTLLEGDETEMFYEVLLQRVRIMQKPYEYNFRCDSPGIARFMRMKLTPQSGNLIRMDIFLEDEVHKLPDIWFYQGDTDSIKRCSVCNRLKSGHQWVDMKDENIFYKDTITTCPVDYTVCNDCIQKLPAK